MSAMPESSASLKTTPEGLFGVANMMARVFGVMARSIAARSGRKPLSGEGGTETMLAPDTLIEAA